MPLEQIFKHRCAEPAVKKRMERLVLIVEQATVAGTPTLLVKAVAAIRKRLSKNGLEVRLDITRVPSSARKCVVEERFTVHAIVGAPD